MDYTASQTGPDGMAFLAETGSGHLVTIDGAPDDGGRNFTPRPMEMVLSGTDGCTVYDVAPILKRGRQDVQDCSVKLHVDRAETDPKVFTRIHLTLTAMGRNLERETVKCVVQLSYEKYCSASVMLAKTAEITHSLELVDLATQPTASE